MTSRYMLVGFIFLTFIILGNYVSAQSVVASSYCFRFTWLGPQHDQNSTIGNMTCAEHLNDIRNIGVPCRTPFVITYDATLPDIDFLYDNYASQVTCRRATGSVCAKFSYTFSGVVQNITYMCTQAYSVGEGSERSGCFSQTVDGQLMEVCLCESAPGERPCNGSTLYKSSMILILILVMEAVRQIMY